MYPTGFVPEFQGSLFKLNEGRFFPKTQQAMKIKTNGFSFLILSYKNKS